MGELMNQLMAGGPEVAELEEKIVVISMTTGADLVGLVGDYPHIVEGIKRIVADEKSVNIRVVRVEDYEERAGRFAFSIYDARFQRKLASDLTRERRVKFESKPHQVFDADRARPVSRTVMAGQCFPDDERFHHGFYCTGKDPYP